MEFGDATAYITAGVGPDLRAVPAQVYEVDQDALELHRNGLLLASQIEDMQVEYWLDNAGTPNGVQDADDEFPVNTLNDPDPPGGAIPADMSQVRRVRVSVLARTQREEGDELGARTAARRTAGARESPRRASFPTASGAAASARASCRAISSPWETTDERARVTRRHDRCATSAARRC